MNDSLYISLYEKFPIGEPLETPEVLWLLFITLIVLVVINLSENGGKIK